MIDARENLSHYYFFSEKYRKGIIIFLDLCGMVVTMNHSCFLHRRFIALLLVVIIYPLLLLAPVVAAARKCPCDNEALCNTIAGPPVRRQEIFGFADASGSDGSEMNWTHITTVAWVHDDRLMCTAHAHGARAILAAPPFDLDRDMLFPEKRTAWIQDALQQVLDNFLDGIVFDYESPQKSGSLPGQAYAKLIAETRDTFHAFNPSLQISTCVPWSPDNIDGRAFPWVQIAQASDLLYVMDYDTRSQIFDACIASANAPFPGMVKGIQRFLDLGIDPGQLVLGVPWYGYVYPCLPGTAPNAIYCPIAERPFRGVNCSDAVGSEVPYTNILKALASSNATVTGGLRRDPNMDAPFFNTLLEGGDGDKNGTNTVYQYWYDDATSLQHKFQWARENGLRGVGPYTFSFLDHGGGDADIWSTFDVFMTNDPSSDVVAVES